MWKLKALVGTFNQEKTLQEAFSMIVQLRRLIVCSTSFLSQAPGDGVVAVDGRIRWLYQHKDSQSELDSGVNYVFIFLQYF